MTRDTLGGFPYEVDHVEGKLRIRFYPEPTARFPDESVLSLRLDNTDIVKLQKILTQ
jgi:hypothetical protein